MLTHKTTVLGFVVLGLALSVAPVQARHACDARGSYLGALAPFGSTFMTKVDGGLNRGTIDVVIADLDPSALGFPAGSRVTALRGGWKRTGRRSITFRLLTFVVSDGAPTILGILKLNGSHVFEANCHDSSVSATPEILLPEQDPLEDTGLPGPPLSAAPRRILPR